MTRRLRVLLAVVSAYAAVYAAMAGWRFFGPAADPHSFMKDPARCGECHLEPRPAAGRPYALMNFRKDIYTLCTRCHPMHLTHPVDIAPGRGRGYNLPLDPDGTMTCITCHAPHSPSDSNRIHTGRSLFERVRDTFFPLMPRRFRTCFLRTPTPGGELCNSCHARRPVAARADVVSVDPARYAGSRACAECHPEQYREWKRTPHARMLRSPRKEPGALLARFSEEPPFPSSEIAYVLGSRHVQRFISLKGGALVVRTPIWLIRAKKWNLSYWREMDWLKSCAGCHTTGFNPYVGLYAEEGISCEACHGPGRSHSLSGRAGDIVHPGKISEVRRAMICESCHTTGHDVTGEFLFPVGFVPGADLRRYYIGLTPKPGQDDATFRGDDSYADRHAQFLFWRSRMLIVEGETCDLCKNFRVARKETEAGGPRKMTSREFCLSCHDGTVLPFPPLHDGFGKEGRSCLSCHPARRNGGGEASIHDHRYVPLEALSKNDFIPRPDFRSICFKCHPVPTKGA